MFWEVAGSESFIRWVFGAGFEVFLEVVDLVFEESGGESIAPVALEPMN